MSLSYIKKLDAIFSLSGSLSKAIPAFKPRAQQLEMAQSVARAIKDNAILVAEAGTGTGKTFAYLVPALLSGGKVIISTGTKNLQDQLFLRDLPMVRKALNVPVTIALLKGRANYICLYRLERAQREGRFMSRDEARYLSAIARYAKISPSGDKSGLEGVPENAMIWAQVTSNRENCLGQECPNHKECFVMNARKQALQSDIVVVNHHLFFADVWLRDEGMTELLPTCNTVIFDEAHQLPETASLFFGESLSTGQLLELTRDTKAEGLAHANDYAALPEAAAELEKAAKDLRLSISGENARFSAGLVYKNEKFIAALDEVESKLQNLVRHLESQAERAEGLENCWRRAIELAQVLKHWRDQTNTELVRWVEVFSQALLLHITPLLIADIFQKQLKENPRSWIFTSATLAVGKDFSHYCAEMGLPNENAIHWDSPFDYPNQALFYVPQTMPDPNSPGYTQAVVEAAFPVLRASSGRAFLLFTSLSAMRRAYDLLQGKFAEYGVPYPIYVQGEGTRNELLERFRQTQNAVLIGSQSFWEGVDVRGEALSVVIIDKLPFASPDDPVLAARIDRINKQGKNAFLDYQLPRAVINLKQGAGRLIRGETDRGVLMICDPRLITRSYGRKIWRNLPPMKRTRELAEVEQFFAQERQTLCVSLKEKQFL